MDIEKLLAVGSDEAVVAFGHARTKSGNRYYLCNSNDIDEFFELLNERGIPDSIRHTKEEYLTGKIRLFAAGKPCGTNGAVRTYLAADGNDDFVEWAVCHPTLD